MIADLSIFVDALRFIEENPALLWDKTVEHLRLSVAAVGVALGALAEACVEEGTSLATGARAAGGGAAVGAQAPRRPAARSTTRPLATRAWRARTAHLRWDAGKDCTSSIRAHCARRVEYVGGAKIGDRSSDATIPALR